MTDEEISENAFNYIKKLISDKTLYNKYIDNKFKSLDSPISFFMAGSPGAGKTEFSKSFIKTLNEDNEFSIIRIDADEIREMCPRYTGENAYLFQKAASKGVEALHEYALKNNFNLLIDGTFQSDRYEENIKRSLKRGRIVHIMYVFQEPSIAWEFAQKRERVEKRKVTLDVFIDTFLKAKENVNNAKKIFGDKIRVDFIKKDYYNKNISDFQMNINSVDSYIQKDYSKEALYNQLANIKID
jgi:predicted ABC-type ATPase